MQLAREAGFQQVAERRRPTASPGVFATLDAGAPRTVGLYFMYDVKQFDPAEWSSPPLEARARGQAGPRQGDDGPRRGEPEGTGGGVPRGAARHPRRGQEAAGQPRARRRGRGGDRLAAHRADRAPARGRGRAARLRRRLHAVGRAGPRRHRHGDPRRQGRGRAGAGLERREVGPRPGEGRPLREPRAGRQPGVAPGAGARHAGLGRRRPRHRRLRRRARADLRRRAGDDRRGAPRASTRRRRRSSSASTHWIARPAVARGERAARVAARR